MKTCVNCGKPLIGKQDKYCCKRCKYKYKGPIEHKCENPRCGKVFVKRSGSQRFCCKGCMKATADGTIRNAKEALERPFTKDTKHIILLWHKQGNSKEEIAKILGRSLENIEQAFG